MEEKYKVKEGKRTLKIIFFTLFLDLVGFSIIFPLFPALLDFYIPDFNKPEQGLLAKLINPIYNIALSIDPENPKFITTVLFGGLLGSLYSLLQFIFAPVWGSMSDIFGRKKILLITISGLAISYLIWAFSGSFWLLIIARIFGGIMGGNISVATAVVADVTPEDKRTSGMAIVGIAFGLGFVLGPAIGGYLGQFSLIEIYPNLEKFGINPFSIVAFFSLLLSIINLIWVSKCLNESLPLSKRSKYMEKSFRIFSAFISENQKVKVLNSTYLIYMIAFSGMEFTLTFLAVDRFNFSTIQNGLMFVYIGLILVITQGLLVRKFTPVVGEKSICLVGILSGIIAFIFIAFSYNLLIFFLALAVMSLSIGTTSPSMSSLVSLCSKESEQGKYLGLFRATGSLARTIGPFTAAILYFLYGPQYSYIIGAILVSISLAIIIRTFMNYKYLGTNPTS